MVETVLIGKLKSSINQPAKRLLRLLILDTELIFLVSWMLYQRLTCLPRNI